jgi:hypothetical protein
VQRDLGGVVVAGDPAPAVGEVGWVGVVDESAVQAAFLVVEVEVAVTGVGQAQVVGVGEIRLNEREGGESIGNFEGGGARAFVSEQRVEVGVGDVKRLLARLELANRPLPLGTSTALKSVTWPKLG